ncbi:MAG: ABC transporter permease [Gemmataceae bacterium]|nr:ABC transporter permease [Gemmataceae bacterium]
MYKLLLCWRYLKTRYLAFACIISVMLGVATLIVVNSVMNGFSTKLQTLLHGVLSDVVIEGHSMEGFHDPAERIARIRKNAYLDSQIESMAVTLEAFAMVQFEHRGQREIATRPVRVMGIEIKSRSEVGGFQEHIASYRTVKKNNEDKKRNDPLPAASFAIPEDLRKLYEKAEEGLQNFRENEFKKAMEKFKEPALPVPMGDGPIGIPDDILQLMRDAKKGQPAAAPIPPPMPVPHVPRVPPGAIVGHLIAHYKYRKPETGKIVEEPAILPGDRVILTTVSGGEKLMPVYDSFVVVDFFKSDMSEYDANCIFVPLEHLQGLRGMDNRASNILIKLKDYNEAGKVVKALAALFEHERLAINTWEEKQGPLLKAIEIEKSILNILLFMIIAVAGFGILAIFSMIVSEKTRDIGVLKALGASSGGVMKIFLTYGLLLGVVGALLGTILGLAITWNINGVEAFIAWLTGTKVFDGGVYYFSEIPTDVSAFAVFMVNLGAIAIAVVFSIIPALRAAMLHPVQALRYE